MKQDNVILEKSKQFAVRIIKLARYLREEKKETILSKQITRSGTSVGANINEAQEAVSAADFKVKLSIALKEARETGYWLELLKETEYISIEQFDSIHTDCQEINKLLISIMKSLKNKTE